MGQCKGKSVSHIEILLTRYGFELKQVAIPELIETWLASYSVYWIRLGIVEALYQGRYKAISVEHILELWKRIGHPIYHFSYEFERLITRHIFIEEVINDNEVHQTEILDTSVPINKSLEVTTENTLTLTPVQELVKKIAIPVSVADNQWSSEPEKKEFLYDSRTESLTIEENETKKQEIDILTQISKKTHPLDGEKPPRSIDQFVPRCDSSGFYSKLRAVAHRRLEEDGV